MRAAGSPALAGCLSRSTTVVRRVAVTVIEPIIGIASTAGTSRIATVTTRGAVTGTRRYQTLEQELEQFVLHSYHASSKDIDKQKVLELARGYLHQAGAADAAEIAALSADAEDGL